jgi:site-specific recombinase XerD
MPRVALEATTDDLADFIDAQPMSAATWYTYIANLRALYGWAKSQGHIAADPSAGLSYVLRRRRAAEALNKLER